MRLEASIQDVGIQLREHVLGTAQANMPYPVQVTIIDGSRQYIDGTVVATYNNQLVQCIAPGTTDVTAATYTKNIVAWALAPNPDTPAGMYFILAVAIDGNTNSRVPVLAGSSITGGGGGTSPSGAVTSVGLAVPSPFTVSGTPITSSGTITIAIPGQSANTVYAGPTGGGAAAPAFRTLVAGDIPSLSGSYADLALSNLSGATSDMLPQYAILAGRAGGQTLSGGTAASENLDLNSTAHATKGIVRLANSLVQANQNLVMAGIGGVAVAAQKLTLYTGADANVGLVIKANSATQSGNLINILDSSAVVMSNMDAVGNLVLGFTDAGSTLYNAVRLYVRKTETGTSGTVSDAMRIDFFVTPSGASTLPVRGLDILVQKTGSQNVTAQFKGMYVVSQHGGTGTVSSVFGGDFEASTSSTGTITTLASLRGIVRNTGSGTITTAKIFYAQPITGGTITNLYGLYIDNANIATTLNYAIFTNAGANHLGDVTTVVPSDTGTNTVLNSLIVSHDSSGVIAAGYGTAILLSGQDTTTADTNMGRLIAEWATATHASYKGRTRLTAYDSAGEREGIRVEASGAAPMLGFYGVAAIARPTNAIAAAAFVANTSGIANDTATWGGYTMGQVVQALQNIGALT